MSENTITRKEALKAEINLIKSKGCVHVIDHRTGKTIKTFLETEATEANNFRQGYIAALMNVEEKALPEDIIEKARRMVWMIGNLASYEEEPRVGDIVIEVTSRIPYAGAKKMPLYSIGRLIEICEDEELGKSYIVEAFNGETVHWKNAMMYLVEEGEAETIEKHEL